MDRAVFRLTSLIVALFVADNALAQQQQPRGASAPALIVVPVSVVATGPQGGPFSPPSFQYRVRSTTGEVNYSISAPSWVTVNAETGTSDTNGVTVTLTINPAALSLPPGTYGPAVKFTNVTNGRGTTARAVRLNVVAHDPAPTGGLRTDRGAPLLDDRGGAILNNRGERLLAR